MLPLAERVAGGILGVAVGDALGLPVEGVPRACLKASPVTGMQGYGSHNKPPGFWSDDTSLTACTAESLLSGFDPEDLGRRFWQWLRCGYWTPSGRAFGIGGTTWRALQRLGRGESALSSGEKGEESNGNGSLMRILPVALYFSAAPEQDLLEAIHTASAITHAHPRSLVACGLYGLWVRGLVAGSGPREAYQAVVSRAPEVYSEPPYAGELSHFRLFLSGRLADLPEEEIPSSGYVVDTLLAAGWAFLTSSGFAETVLRAVNLGGDTDTVAAVAGGLAGVCYGVRDIPRAWREALARSGDLAALAARFARVVVRRVAGAS